MAEWRNQLWFGDNLEILRDQVADESVDLLRTKSEIPACRDRFR